jgi:SAM-dependent methyltransferase
MNLLDIVRRQPKPEPWREGDNIPWHEPQFSRRMLDEHLTQAHDAASRRFPLIDRHVAWIHEVLLLGRPSRILDLGCGPGLYANRLARLGHTCTGIDFSPASIRYAQATAQAEHLACTFIEQDIRRADYGSGYDLAMLIFGEFNVFSQADADLILDKLYQALRPDGLLLLEPHTYTAVWRIGLEAARWSAAEQGLFCDRPHLYLTENFWEPASQIATCRYYTIDALTGQVSQYAQSLQAYSDGQYRARLARRGFGEIAFFAGLGGTLEAGQEDFMAITARKQEKGNGDG